MQIYRGEIIVSRILGEIIQRYVFFSAYRGGARAFEGSRDTQRYAYLLLTHDHEGSTNQGVSARLLA